MFPISSGFSKSLLPITNRPMVWFQLDLVAQAGFREVYLIISSEYATQYTNFIDMVYKKNSKYSLKVHIIAQTAVGTADALRLAAPRINSSRDLILISGDVVSDMPLSLLAIQHRVHNATLTVCLRTPAPPAPAPEADKTKGKNDKKDKKAEADSAEEVDDVSRQYIALETTTGRVGYIRSVNNVEDFLSFSKYSLQRLPDMTIFTNLANSHVYIVTHNIFNLLEEHPRLSSFQNEVVPLITAMQFAPETQKWATIPSSDDGMNDVNILSSPVSAISASSTSSISSASTSNVPSGISGGVRNVNSSLTSPAVVASHARPLANNLTHFVRVQGFVVPQQYFMQRCNTLAAFRKLNAMFLPQSNTLSKYFPHGIPPMASAGSVDGVEPMVVTGKAVNTIFGNDVRLDKCTIENSVIGNHCRIGLGARLTNVIMLDNASVEAGATLSNTVVGAEARVDNKAVLKNCAIGRGVHIPAEDRRVNENILDNKNLKDDDYEEDEDYNEGEYDDEEYTFGEH